MLVVAIEEEQAPAPVEPDEGDEGDEAISNLCLLDVRRSKAMRDKALSDFLADCFGLELTLSLLLEVFPT
jgi:hypothetical protein